jgi:membrane protease subunit HflC
MKGMGLIYAIVILIIIILVSGTAFTVDETEQAIITRFGKPVRQTIKRPGLYFKLPFVEKAIYFYKNLLEWDGEKGQIPTLDKTFIWVDTFARWKISDPLQFYKSVRTTREGMRKLDDIIDPAVRNHITSYSLIESVRNTNREMDTFEVGLEGFEKKKTGYIIEVGREKITQGIQEEAKPKLAQFGIELVDVRIKRINYVEEVQKTVFSRMIANRKQIAEKFRSEGKGEARKIEGDLGKEMQKITSQAYKTAQEVKGKADAEATQIYSQAYGKDPEFYSFLMTLDLYKETLNKNSTMILSTDNDLFRYLKNYAPYKGSEP